MSASDDFETAVRALAKMSGKTPDQIKLEMLRAHMIGGGASEEAPATALARAPGSGDASGASLARSRADAIEQHNAESFPGSPVVRYKRDPYRETPSEAMERWLEEETELPDGVHGLGGTTAGGIFGEAPISTSIYDPQAMGRAESRAGQAVNIRIARVLDKLEQRLDAAMPKSLSGRGTKRLPR